MPEFEQETFSFDGSEPSLATDEPAKKRVRRGRPKKVAEVSEPEAEKISQPVATEEAPMNESTPERKERNRNGGFADRPKRRRGHDQNHKRKGGDRPQNQRGGNNRKNNNKRQHNNKRHKKRGRFMASTIESDRKNLELGDVKEWEMWSDADAREAFIQEHVEEGALFDLMNYYSLPQLELNDQAEALDMELEETMHRVELLQLMMEHAFEKKAAIRVTGIIELWEEEEGALVVYEHDNYRIKPLSTYVPDVFIKQYNLKQGQSVEVLVAPPAEGRSCPVAIQFLSIMDEAPEANMKRVPFNDLIPYYPTERLFLETGNEATWDNISMRVIDVLTPIGLGQRGLIVAPPRTGKTVLLQSIAHAIADNRPDLKLIVLLVDERPEEVTDFKRQVKGEVISSTFDESAESHVHAAEMVIEKARRMVEAGQHVVILLDSITRLARAYNTMMPNSGKILSGGVEANALQSPKRFFGSARNIEGGGSLTILGSALVETGSRMDEVIFEEFKGTGNMELHLDRALSDKRIYPALSFEKSGTRKEELLYHKDELNKIYSLRRAMKGVPPVEAMEMLIQRIKKSKSNAEFLMSLNR